MKFAIYERVTSKKTGLPMTGTICGLVLGAAFENNYIKNYNRKLDGWNELYPDFRSKFVYYVYFDTPAKPVTKEEVQLKLQEGEDLEEVYDKIKTQVMAAYPEDDLELLETGVLA